MEVFDSGMGFEYFSGCLGTFSNGLVRNAVARSRTKVPTLLQRRGGEANAKVALQEAGCEQWGYWAYNTNHSGDIIGIFVYIYGKVKIGLVKTWGYIPKMVVVIGIMMNNHWI